MQNTSNTRMRRIPTGASTAVSAFIISYTLIGKMFGETIRPVRALSIMPSISREIEAIEFMSPAPIGLSWKSIVGFDKKDKLTTCTCGNTVVKTQCPCPCFAAEQRRSKSQKQINLRVESLTSIRSKPPNSMSLTLICSGTKPKTAVS
jgi:hypothetical protein